MVLYPYPEKTKHILQSHHKSSFLMIQKNWSDSYRYSSIFLITECYFEAIIGFTWFSDTLGRATTKLQSFKNTVSKPYRETDSGGSYWNFSFALNMFRGSWNGSTEQLYLEVQCGFPFSLLIIWENFCWTGHEDHISENKTKQLCC